MPPTLPRRAQRVGHCAYDWNALQLVELTQALLRLNTSTEQSDVGQSQD